MDVTADCKEMRQCGVVREMCSDAHLDLTVIGDDQGVALFRYDALTKFRGARQILQIGVAAGKAAGLRRGDQKARMDAPGSRADMGGELRPEGVEQALPGAQIEQWPSSRNMSELREVISVYETVVLGRATVGVAQ